MKLTVCVPRVEELLARCLTELQQLNQTGVKIMAAGAAALANLQQALNDNNAVFAEVADGLKKLADNGSGMVAASSVQAAASSLESTAAANKAAIEAAFATLGVTEPAPPPAPPTPEPSTT